MADLAMRFAYADPPYLGMGARMYGHPEWDSVETHRALIDSLCANYPDGWALSATSGSLQTLLPMCPSDVRVMAWCKPWAKYLPGLSPAFAWEPVILRGGRKIDRQTETAKDWHVGFIPLRRDKPENFVPGMKPRSFCRWLFQCLNAHSDDTLDDLFPGSGAVGAAWAEWTASEYSRLPTLPLFAEGANA